jgi:hypothetical protein
MNVVMSMTMKGQRPSFLFMADTSAITAKFSTLPTTNIATNNLISILLAKGTNITVSGNFNERCRGDKRHVARGRMTMKGL